MAERLKYLIIHCTATPAGRSVTADTVRNWHTKPRPVGRGWSRVGYGDLILLDGSRHRFTKNNQDANVDPYEITNGVGGKNSQSRHVCYVGGLDGDGKTPKDTLTQAQNSMLSSIIAEVLSYAPWVEIAGHNQFANKSCPSLWVPRYLRERCLVKVPEKNIYNLDPFNYGKSGLF